mgnify:CR=1 FL=1
MLRIQYLDKDRFMRQVAASKGSVYLHLDNGETCDLKKDSAATELFQMMKAPAKGFSISVADPADVTGFLHYMLEAGRKADMIVVEGNAAEDIFALNRLKHVYRDGVEV